MPSTKMSSSYHYVLKIAYRGTPFLGWQKTGTGLSVQGVLESTLQKILQDYSLETQGASRTDRGVHALGQIVDFTIKKPILNLDRFQTSLNQLLPKEITCSHIQRITNPAFHPSLSTIGKCYEYKINKGKVPSPFHLDLAWHIHYDLDISLMEELAKNFQGTHDFYGFCNQREGLSYTTTVRNLSTISLKTTQEYNANIITFTLIGDNFLYKMARNIVGTLVWVGVKKIPYEQALQALLTQNRTLAGVTAPAHGLTLVEVLYPFTLFSDEV